MKTIDELVVNEIVIERSRFICHLKRISSIEDGSNFVKEMKKKYHDANHNCSAMVFHNNARSSDDGEPSSTAGVPMLNVLMQNELDEVVAVVTRYFGGIKLGAGGLIRAYSSSVSETLKVAEIVNIVEMTEVEIMVDYSHANTIKNKISLEIQKQEYLSDVRITFYVNPNEVDSFLKEIQNLTSANFTHEIKGTILYKEG